MVQGVTRLAKRIKAGQNQQPIDIFDIESIDHIIGHSLEICLASSKCTVAAFIVPDCIGLSHRPARLHRLAGQYDNPCWR
jgi:hypothetical protein